MYEERSRIYGRLTQTAAMLVAFGAFVIVYDKNDQENVRNESSDNNRPNIEAILVKDEELYTPAQKVNVPRKRTNGNGLCDKFAGTDYVRKQQM